MDTADAARVTEAVTGAVADAVKRGESYSSLEDFLTDESVERMTEAVIEEAAKTLGLADADDAGVNEKKLGDSRVAALKDMAKESLTEQFRRDGELRDTAERVRQKRREGIAGKPYDYLNGIPVEYYGNSVLLPPEYGIVYSDGKRNPVVVSPYSEAKPIIKQLELPDTRAHHVAPNAIYRDTIARNDGITISLPGNVLTNPESAHGKFHNHTETQMDMYRESNTRPTNREAYEIFLASLQTAGVNKDVAEFSLDWMIRQQMERGIYPEMPIPRMPQKIHFKKKNVVEEDAGNAENIQ